MASVIDDIIIKIQRDIDYFSKYQKLLQRWIIIYKMKSIPEHTKFLNELTEITTHIANLKQSKFEYELLREKLLNI